MCGCANDLSYWCLIHEQGRLKGNSWSFLLQLCKFVALAGVPVPSAKEQRNAPPVKRVETDSIMLHKMVVNYAAQDGGCAAKESGIQLSGNPPNQVTSSESSSFVFLGGQARMRHYFWQNAAWQETGSVSREVAYCYLFSWH